MEFFCVDIDADHKYVKYFDVAVIFYVSSGAIAASLSGLPNYLASKIQLPLVRCNIFLELLIVIDLVRSIPYVHETLMCPSLQNRTA